MLCPNRNLLVSIPILTGVNGSQRTRPFLAPFLQCSFCQMHQHQFVCDPIVTNSEVHTLQCEKKSSTDHRPVSGKGGSRQQQQQHPAVLSTFLINHPIRLLTHPYLLLAYLAFVAYWPSLWADLVFDDRPAIVENKDLRPDTHWSRVWFDDFWGTPLKSSFSHKSYRPVTVLTFRLNYHFHQLQPLPYHLVNLILHTLVSILFYRFCLEFFEERPKIDHHRSTSLLIAILFAVHPIHTDCVASVVGRAELLSAIFYLLSIELWNRKSTGNGSGDVGTSVESVARRIAAPRSKSTHWLQLLANKRNKLVSILFAIIGFLCKEQSIFVLMYLAFSELLPLSARRSTTRHHHHQAVLNAIKWATRSPINRRSKWNNSTALPTILLLAAVFLLTVYIRFVLMDYTLPAFNRFDNPAFQANFPSKQLTYAYLGFYHFWLLLLPLNLSCDWTHVSIELIDFSTQHFYHDVVRTLTMLAIGTVLALATVRLFASVAKLSPTPFWIEVSPTAASTTAGKCVHATLLTLLPFIPASNLLFPTGFVIAERVLYLPSIGFLLLFGIGVRRLYQNGPRLRSAQTGIYNRLDKVTAQHLRPKSVSNGICSSFNSIWKLSIRLSLAALVVTFMVKTHHRSLDWNNEYSLYESGLLVNPRNTKLLNNMGRLHEKNQNMELAISIYRQAISIESKDIRSYLNLANALVQINEKENAERIYREALAQIESDTESGGQQSRVPPLYFTALIRLAALIEENPGREAELKQIRTKMIALQSVMSDSTQVKGHYNPKHDLSCDSKCGRTYEDANKLDHLYNIAIVHYKQGHLKQALTYFDKVLTLNPHHEGSLLASARIIQDEDIHQLNSVAFERLNHLVRLGKGDESVFFNLAMLAIKGQHYSQAKQLFEKAISIRHSFTEAHYNLALLLIKDLNSAGEQRNFEQAVYHLKLVLSINPKHVKSMLVLGDLFAEELNQLDQSRHYYQMVVSRIDRHNVRARNNLCVLWYKQGDSKKSIDCFVQLKRELIKSADGETLSLISEQISVLQSSLGAQSKPANKDTTDSRPANKSCQNNSWEITKNDDFNSINYRQFFISNQFESMCFT